MIVLNVSYFFSNALQFQGNLTFKKLWDTSAYKTHFKVAFDTVLLHIKKTGN